MKVENAIRQHTEVERGESIKRNESGHCERDCEKTLLDGLLGVRLGSRGALRHRPKLAVNE